MVSLSDIKAAHDRIRRFIHHTPIMTSRTINSLVGCEVFFKCENFQRTGAFKIRGAFNTLLLLSEEEKARGVIAHSSGNHAQAVALAARLLGISATIVMPRDSSAIKLAATRGYGAKVVLSDPTLEARVEDASRLIAKHDYTLIHPYDDSRIIAGAGTAALEFIDEIKQLDHILTPIGGGGLVSGTAIASKGLLDYIQVIGVEPANADDAYRSYKSGKLVPSIDPITIADGLRTSLSKQTFSLIRKHVDEIIRVSETEIIEAMRLLWERMKLIVEPSGVVPLAGLKHLKRNEKPQRVGIILSGGNIDLEMFFSHLTDSIQ